MRTYFQPIGLLAGFMAEQPEAEVPELEHIGEQWAPRDFLIPLHEHATWELYVQVSGESKWESGGVIYTLEPGGLFVAAPGVRHALHGRPPGRHHFYFAAVDLRLVFDRLPDLAMIWADRDIVFTPHAESTLTPFRQLVREVSLDQPFRPQGIRAALDAMVIEASRVASSTSDVNAIMRCHPAVERAKGLIDEHPEERWTLDKLSNICGLSAHHLVERFTAEVGVPPHQYLMRSRAERAKELLAQTSLPITDIGMELGYCSGQHFAASFKKLVGTSPIKYRQHKH
jgi:AraC-like DNA-binding protein